MTRNSLYDLVAQCVLKLSRGTEQSYTTYTKETEHDEPEVVVIVVENENNSCFHIAITGSNTNIKNAKVVCCQAILYRSSEDNPDLYCSVYDKVTQMVLFCLFSPSKQELKDVSCYSTQREADKVAEWLKTYVVSNADNHQRSSIIENASVLHNQHYRILSAIDAISGTILIE
jgi:malonyl CoA-acyl carrier protein transacylase